MRDRSRRTFADVVQEAREAPRRPDRARAVSSATLTDPTGRQWHEVEESIAEARAQELVLAGAELAWDGCGSRGYAAPVTWISRREAALLAAAGPPTLRMNKRHSAALSAWRTDDGSWLVLATMSVTWGKRLA